MAGVGGEVPSGFPGAQRYSIWDRGGSIERSLDSGTGSEYTNLKNNQNFQTTKDSDLETEARREILLRIMSALKPPAPMRRSVDGSGVWLTVRVPVFKRFPLAV